MGSKMLSEKETILNVCTTDCMILGGGLLVQVQHVHKGKGMPAGTCEQTFLVFLSPGLDKCIPVAFATQVLGTSTENRVGSRNFAKLNLEPLVKAMSV